MSTNTTTTITPADDGLQRLIAITEAANLRAANEAGFGTVQEWKADQAAKAEAAQQAREAAAAQARAEREQKIKEREALELSIAKQNGFATYAELCEHQRQEQLKAQRKEQAGRLFRAAGFPSRYVEALTAGVTLTQQQEQIAKSVMPLLDTGGIVGLLGQRGTGKTLLSAWIGRETCAQVRTVHYCKVLDYFRAIKDTFSRDAEKTEREVVQQYANYGLLILDEAAERSGSDWELTQLTDLLDRRYSTRRATLLISNHTRAGMTEALGPSICSRLREDGDVFELAGDSYREVIRAERQANHAK
jgi:DNA replication protein DnaC